MIRATRKEQACPDAIVWLSARSRPPLLGLLAMSAASRASGKRCKHTCGLCAAVVSLHPGDEMHGCPELFLCSTCNDFVAEVLGIDARALANMRKRQQKKFEAVKGHRDEWAASKENIDSIAFPQEEIFEETTQISELDETFKFMSRQRFHQKHHCFPEQAKVSQIKVLNHKQEEITGVAIELDEPEDPILHLRTQKVLVHRRPIMKSEQHLFRAQGALKFESLASSKAANLGQKCGNKYVAKIKHASTYSEAEISDLVGRNASRTKSSQSVVDALMAGECAHEDGDVESGAESGDDASQHETECGASAVGPTTAPRTTATSPRTSLCAARATKAPSCASKSPKLSPAKGLLGKCSGLQRGASKQLFQDDRSRSPASRSAKLKADSVGPGAPSVASGSTSLGEADSARQKPPEYWFDTITPAKVFANQSVKRACGWARDCVGRLARVGESIKAQRLSEHMDMIDRCCELMADLSSEASFDDMLDKIQQLVKDHVEFDPSIQTKLLGKRLSSVINALKVESSSLDCKEFIDMLSPFKDIAGEEDDDDEFEGVIQEVDHDKVEDSTTPSQFDPLKPRLMDTDGSQQHKLCLVQKLLMADVLPALISLGEGGLAKASDLCRAIVSNYEDGVANMAETPQVVLDTMAICEVMLAVTDSTQVAMDFDALETFFGDLAKHKKTVQVDFGIMLRLDTNCYKAKVDELQACLADARSRLPDIAAKAKSLDTCDVPPTQVDIDLLSDCYKTISTCRACLRRGSTHILEVACRSYTRRLIERLQTDGQQYIIPKDWSSQFLEKLKDLLKEGSELNILFDVRGASTALSTEVRVRSTCALAWELMEKLKAPLDLDKNAVNPQKFAHLQNHLSTMSGLLLDEEQNEECIESLRHYRDILSLGHGKHPGGFGTLVNVCKLLRASAEKDSLERRFNNFDLAAKIEASMAAHMSLGPDMDARVHADGHDMLCLKSLQLHILEAKSSVESCKEEGKSEFVLQVLAHAEKHCSDAALATVAPLHTHLSARTAESQGWARGGGDGSSWHIGLATDATLDEALGVAKATLLSKLPDVYEARREELASDLKKLKEVASALHQKLPDGLEQQVQQVISFLGLSFIEGLLCALYMSKQSKEVYKSKTHAIRKLVRGKQCDWQQVHKSLQTRATKAAKLQL